MRHGIIRWYDPKRESGVAVDIVTLQQLYMPRDAAESLGLESIPKNTHIFYTSKQQGDTHIIGACRLVEGDTKTSSIG